MRAHGHANRGNAKMQRDGMGMTNGLIPNMREPQPHSHGMPIAENEVPRNACTRARKPRQCKMRCNMAKMMRKHVNGISETKYGGKQSRNEAK